MIHSNFSLAGMIVIYAQITSYENNKFEMVAIDNYQHPFADFIREIDKIYERTSENTDPHTSEDCFLVVGLPDQVNELEEIMRQNIQTAFDKLIKYSNMHMVTCDRNALLSVDLLSKLYLEQLFRNGKLRFPLAKCIAIDRDLSVLCLYSSEGPNAGSDSVDLALDMWMQRERPWLMGKQPMTQSFSFRKLEGRRIIACTPSPSTGEWMQLLEGGIGLSLNGDEGLLGISIAQHTEDISAGYIHAILNNPAYAYGKMYHSEIFREWNLTFLYGLAMLGIPMDDSNAVHRLYHRFLLFIEKYVSDYETCPTIIDEHLFLTAYARAVEDTKSYLRGHEERSISRDAIMMMRSRYGYLRHMYEIIQAEYPAADFHCTSCIEMTDEEYYSLIATLNSSSKAVRGRALEDVAAYFFESIEGLRVMGRRLRETREEIDLCIANASLDSELWKLGALILVECKNWSYRVDVPVIRNLSHILLAKKGTVGVLFARSGVTTVAEDEIYQQALNGQHILVIDDQDLQRIWKREIKPKEMLMLKYASLRDRIKNDTDQLF